MRKQSTAPPAAMTKAVGGRFITVSRLSPGKRHMALQSEEARRDEERAGSYHEKDDRNGGRLVPGKLPRHLIPDHHGRDEIARTAEERGRDKKSKR